MIGALGKDMYGEHIEGQLREYGVDTSCIHKADATGLGVNNVLPDGSVFGNIVRGANFALTQDYIAGWKMKLPRAQWPSFRWRFLSRSQNLASGFAKKHGCYVILNAAPALPLTRTSWIW